MDTSNLVSDTAAETQGMNRSWPEIDGFGLCGEMRGGRGKR